MFHFPTRPASKKSFLEWHCSPAALIPTELDPDLLVPAAPAAAIGRISILKLNQLAGYAACEIPPSVIFLSPWP
jgi:hypothetical protein